MLALVGTIHLDPEGYPRLILLFERLRPQVISVELSQYALKFRRQHGQRLRERLSGFRRPDGTLPEGLAAVEAQLEIPFEYRAAHDYARLNRAKLVCIGDSRRSQALLSLLERELMATDNLVTLALRRDIPLAELVACEWVRAKREFEKSPLAGTDLARRLASADRKMARRIRVLATPGANLVHVGGWEHLAGLTSLLSDLAPQVTLLAPETLS
ncbi:MAG: hypothetical protein GYA21_05035 [Myxococcales bacterium]|nr:hypothetical protein [Myxococcales bacterium]